MTVSTSPTDLPVKWRPLRQSEFATGIGYDCRYQDKSMRYALRQLDEIYENDLLNLIWQSVDNVSDLPLPVTLDARLVRIINAKKLANPEQILRRTEAVYRSYETSSRDMRDRPKACYQLLVLDPLATIREISLFEREIEIHSPSTFDDLGKLRFQFRKLT